MTVKDWQDRGVLLTPKLTFKSDVPLDAKTLEQLRNQKAELLSELTSSVGILPKLPSQLEPLIRAASSDLLPKGTVRLESGLVYDLSSYTLAWAAAYLIGDRQHALARLWEVWKIWQDRRLS